MTTSLLPPAEVLEFAGSGAWPRPTRPVLEVESAAAKDVKAELVGYLTSQFGLGEAARAYAHALIAHGAELTLRDVDPGPGHERQDRSLEPCFLSPTSVAPSLEFVFVNPDRLGELAGWDAAGDRLRVACWFWELETLPAAWRPWIERMDAFIAPSGFIAQSLGAATDKPVLLVPQPVERLPGVVMSKADFGLDEAAFVFLTMLDLNSTLDRKNPEGAIMAFKRAFPPDSGGVRLLVKVSNGRRHPVLLHRLLALAASDKRIIIRDAVLATPHAQALQAACDAYVSLHRAEGFGLALAEAMLAGKPVIATGWSGNMQFMDETNSCLVGYQLVPIARTSYPHAEGQRWAEPDLDDAARWMANLVADRALGERIGEAGRQSASISLAPRAAAEELALACASLTAGCRGLDTHGVGP